MYTQYGGKQQQQARNVPGSTPAMNNANQVSGLDSSSRSYMNPVGYPPQGGGQGMHPGYGMPSGMPGRGMPASVAPPAPTMQGQAMGLQGRYPPSSMPPQYRSPASTAMPRQPQQLGGGTSAIPGSQPPTNPLVARPNLGGVGGGMGPSIATGPGRPSQGLDRSGGGMPGPVSGMQAGGRAVGGTGVAGIPQMVNLSGRAGSAPPGSMGVHSGTGRAITGSMAGPEVLSVMGKGSMPGQVAGGLPQMVGGTGSVSGEKDAPVFDNTEFPSLSGALRRPVDVNGELGQGFGASSGDLYGGVLNLQQKMGLDFSMSRDEFPALPGSEPGSFPGGAPVQTKDGSGSIANQMPQFPALSRFGSAPPGFGPPGQANSSNAGLAQESMPISASAPGHSESTPTPGFYSGMGGTTGAPPSSEGYEHLMKQQEQLRQSQATATDADNKSSDKAKVIGSTTEGTTEHYGLLGLLGVIRMNDPDLSTLALGTDLTTLGLNLNSSDSLFKTFSGPWSDAPARIDPDFQLPACYSHQVPRLQLACFTKFQLETLFYIFYSMPGDELQLFAADELASRGWWFHKEMKVWLSRVVNMEPTVKTDRFERGSFWIFDTNTWERVRKDGLLVQYEQLERSPGLPRGGPPSSAPSSGKPA